EPTTGLDPVLVNTIHHLILDLHRRFRFTAVVVSHEIPEIFEIADTVAMLHEGRIVEVGPPAAIQASTNPVVQRFLRGEPENGRAGERFIPIPRRAPAGRVANPATAGGAHDGGKPMERTRVNIAVGIFVILGILALGYLSISLGQVSFLGGRGYVVTVDFPSVGGLKAGSTVEIAGVEIGRV